MRRNKRGNSYEELELYVENCTILVRAKYCAAEPDVNIPHPWADYDSIKLISSSGHEIEIPYLLAEDLYPDIEAEVLEALEEDD